MARDPLAPLYEQFFANLPEGYIPSYEFGYADGEGGGSYLYARPARSYAQQFPGFAPIREKFATIYPDYNDPDWERYFNDPGYTQQDYYTGKVPEAEQIFDESNLDPKYQQDYDIWQQLLSIGQQRQDDFSIWGDQFSQALMALGLATGGAAAFGGFSAPVGEVALSTGAGAGADAGVGGAYTGLTAGAPELLTAGGATVGEAAPIVGGAGSGAALGAGGGAGVATGTGGFLGSLLGTGGGGWSWAPVVAAGISAGGNLLGGLLASNAAKDAAKTQAGAASDANALLAAIYGQQREDLLPWMQTGRAALGDLASLTSSPLTLDDYVPTDSLNPNNYAFDTAAHNFAFPRQAVQAGDYAFTPPPGDELLSKDPGYQFRLAQGRRAIEQGAAARGNLLGGGTLKGLTRYGQELASQEYGNAYNRALGENMLGYERARNEVGDVNAQALAENELGYNRDLAGNQLRYSRDAAMHQDLEGRNRYQYGTNLANLLGLRDRRYNELANLAGIGQVSTGQANQLAGLYGAQAANNITGAGAATAAGDVGAANAWANAFSGSGNALNSFLQFLAAQNLRYAPAYARGNVVR